MLTHASVFAGNAIVIKTSEYASWSTKFYGRMIKACLAAAGAPEDLAQIVTGYGDAGHALVTGGAFFFLSFFLEFSFCYICP